MTQPIDTAYVDIVARDKSLAKLRRDIDNTFDDIDKGINKDLKSIDEHFEDLFEKIDQRFHDVERSIDGVFQEIIDIAADTSLQIEKDFDRTEVSVRRNFRKISEEAESSFDAVEKKFNRPFKKAMSKIGDIVSETGRVLSQLGGTVGSLVTSSPLLILILALTPAIIALAAALSQLIGVVALIPGGFAVLLSVIIPVVVAFQNFGDAVSALASGDVDKINEALKKLSPSAASVAREIAGLLPRLRSFQRIVQEGFFAPIVGDFTNVVRELFPTLEKGFFEIARSMGILTSSFAELFVQQSSLQVFRETFATTARIITELTGPLRRFTDMLLNTIHKSLPFIERMAAAFGRALDTFSAFVNKSIETGDFDQFIEDAITTIKELIDLVKSVAALIGTIFAGTETSGHELLKTLTAFVNKINEFLKTEDGIKTLDLLAKAVGLFGSMLLFAADTLIFFGTAFFNTLEFLEGVGRGFVSVMSTIIDWVTRAKDTVVNDFNNMVTIISNLPEIIMGLGPKFLNAGKNLIQSFMNGFRAVGGFIGDVAGDIVAAVKGFLNKAIDRVNRGIETIDNVLPGSLGRIPRLAEGALVRHRPGGILANIGEGTEDEVVAPLSKLEKMTQGSGTTVTFGPNAINISFAGVMPTEQEARQMGETVGHGIINMLARRNMRVQVRAV